MNRNHLAIFRVVAEEGKMSRAAEVLHISQPAVSSQVGQLERQLGAQLFDREPRGVRLTAVGEELYDYARRIGQLEKEAEAAVADHLRLGKGRLAVGASTSIGSYLLPQALGRFAHRFPGIQLSLSISNTEGIQRDLLDGTLDLGLTEGFASEAAFQITIFHQDEVLLVVPPSHPFAGRESIPLTELTDHPLLVREPGSGTRAVVERAFLERGFELRAAMSLGSSEALKRGVLAGLGLALVSELAVRLELELGYLVSVPIEDFEIRRPLHLLRPVGRQPSGPARAFAELLLDSERGDREGGGRPVEYP